MGKAIGFKPANLGKGYNILIKKGTLIGVYH